MDRGATIISILAEAQVWNKFTMKASNMAFKIRPVLIVGSLYSDLHHPHAVPRKILRQKCLRADDVFTNGPQCVSLHALFPQWPLLQKDTHETEQLSHEEIRSRRETFQDCRVTKYGTVMGRMASFDLLWDLWCQDTQLLERGAFKCWWWAGQKKLP